MTINTKWKSATWFRTFLGAMPNTRWKSRILWNGWHQQQHCVHFTRVMLNPHKHWSNLDCVSKQTVFFLLTQLPYISWTYFVPHMQGYQNTFLLAVALQYARAITYWQNMFDTIDLELCANFEFIMFLNLNSTNSEIPIVRYRWTDTDRRRRRYRLM